MKRTSLLTLLVAILTSATAFGGGEQCPDEDFYGQGTAGTGGFVPAMDTAHGKSEIGNSKFEIQVELGLGGAPGTMFIATNSANLPLPGMGVDLAVLPPWMLVPFTLNNPGTPGGGQFKLPAPIPDDSALVGLNLYFQAIITDAGAAQGFSATGGMHIIICSG